MAVHYINIHELDNKINDINCGDEVYLSGTIYTARDAVHKRLASLIDEGKELPIDLRGVCVYYAGPTPEREGQIIGSCGPTTSSRMDKFTPLLLQKGLLAMIGKGPRSKEVVDAIKMRGGIYFCAIGGAGALCAQSVKSYEVIAFSELGCESLKKMEVENFPVICAIDSNGTNIFEKGLKK